jgi:hypothetical protein
MNETESAMKPKRSRKTKTKSPDKKPRPTAEHTIGMRKTRLMELAEGYGDTGMMNPRSIDPLVYLLAELGEAAFGKSVIDHCQDGIALSNAGFPRKRALGFLADQMVRKYLAAEFKSLGKTDTASRLTRMPVLNDASYVDYFMTVSMLDRDAFRTLLHPVVGEFVKLISGYETEQPGNVCQTVVEFFRVTNNQTGFEELLTGLCGLVKLAR